MKILHSLNICHGDIKNSNIAWSPHFQKMVFLDFGFSLPVKEEIGGRTYTRYFGTFDYSIEEFKKAYFLKTEVYVDLYYNDLYCLQKTLRIFS